MGDNWIRRGLYIVCKSGTTIKWIKGIVHFEINLWYVLAYLKGIQDVGVFVSAVFFNFDIFRSNRSCLSVI